MKTPFTKVTTWSSFVTSIVARLMKATISPTVAAPFWCRAMPVMKIAVMVSVPDARVATLASAHHDRTGICTRSRSWMMLRIASLGPGAGEGLDDRDVAERVGRMGGETRLVLFDLALKVSVRRRT